jgi:hypothetical protein
LSFNNAVNFWLLCFCNKLMICFEERSIKINSCLSWTWQQHHRSVISNADHKYIALLHDMVNQRHGTNTGNYEHFLCISKEVSLPRWTFSIVSAE